MGAALYTPLDAWEQRTRGPRTAALSASLIEHLNEHLEYYHHALWWTMDPNRRYMLLDGFVAPNSGDRSIASVVENRLIGIVGNSLVLPVANGSPPRSRASRSDGRTEGRPLLRLAVRHRRPLPPASVSLPTRGVFAEAVMGECNACEDDRRLAVLALGGVADRRAARHRARVDAHTRRAEPAVRHADAVPDADRVDPERAGDPDPAGVAAALDALGKQSFADITGLAGTQANAAAAYGKAMDTALAFGKEASTLAQAGGGARRT